METTILIGHYIEAESRRVNHSPSTYAADWEILETKPGRYPIKMSFSSGYVIPMPQWLLIGIEADRVEGKSYSGFAGNNFASRDLPRGPKNLFLQMQVYNLGQLVEEGKAEIFPEYQEVVEDYLTWAKGQTWADLGEIMRAEEGNKI